MFTFEIRSHLDAPAETVWEHAGTLAGVNYELGPFIRMTAPRKYRDARIDDWETGLPLFRSWVFLGGFLPWDLHHFKMARIERGRAFHEESQSLFQREWRHDRLIEPSSDGATSTVVDLVRFAPRIYFLGRLALPILRAIFGHRHRRLLKKFGAA